MIRCRSAACYQAILACLVLALILSSCRPAATASGSQGNANPPASPSVFPTEDEITPSPRLPISPSPSLPISPSPSPLVTPSPSRTRSIWLAGSVPQQLAGSLKLPDGWTTALEADAGLRLDVYQGTNPGTRTARWIYALVAPFSTVADEVTLSDLQAVWKGAPPAKLPFTTLLVEDSTAKAFAALWGPASNAVQVKPVALLLDAAWAAKGTWAIVPFEQIEPRWKVIAVDGQSPLRKEFDPSRYGLAVSFALQGHGAALQGAYAALERLQAEVHLPESNRLADRLTTVMVTGTTALVRGTASLMEQRGLDYPAQDIGDWLRSADILHISNEVSFAKTCPEPYNWKGLKFCSRTKYIKLLEDIGADVVELTGDHFQDWGPDAVHLTMEMYRQEGWQTYGGGDNIEAASKPALFENNGNKIAFIGCNAKAKGYATVSATTPGALHCDMDAMAASVKSLRGQGYQVIVTFQHLEYYSYTIHPILQKDFRQMADAGAVIVSGSQAHMPLPFEFRSGALLHYGLGNLFFDQTNQGAAPRDAFIDRHVFYNGRYLGTELLTIYLVDYARSRPMIPAERQAILTTIFKASGWVKK